MDTSRDDVSISIRSALLSKGTKQKFSLLVLIIVSIFLLFIERIETKPLNYFRSFIKDVIYRGALVVTYPSKTFNGLIETTQTHFNLYKNYNLLKDENIKLKNDITKSDFLELENTQLRKLIEEQILSNENLVSARVMIDKQSPYLNSFILNIGNNKKIKNGMPVLHQKNFIGRIVDVNFFSSRVLLVTDLNSKIPIIVEPLGLQGILSGRGLNNPTIEYLPENSDLNDGDRVYTSGKEGIFSPGVPIGEVKMKNGLAEVLLHTKLDQITFVNIDIGERK